MAIVDSRVSVWEALAGRAPGQPTGPAEPGLWAAVVERLNPARAKPQLRDGIEEAHLVSVRDVPYVMLRSPDDRGRGCYLRLTPEEVVLARLMDGTRTVARLVAEFARISGRLAPDQVTRVVADLAANRMLAELPVDAFRPLDRVHRRPWPVRAGRGLLAMARGRRMVLADIDPLVGFLYRAGGRLLFTRPAAIGLGVVALAGLLLFGWTWWRADQSVFLTGGSYAVGAAVLLGLNVLALACHELGHALATRHAGRRVPAAGFLVYFGIPSVFVDTTDVWMAGRRARMVTTAAGPAAGLVLAGAAQIVGLFVPEAAPWTFKLAFAWYLNALFNLNPFLALDGYYLLMDWLEIPNLRARGLAFVVNRLRRRPPSWSELDREGRLVALYGTLAVLWLAIAVNIGYRVWSDRVSGLVIGLWRAGWPARLLLCAVVAGLAAPAVYLCAGWIGHRLRRARRWLAERRDTADTPRRLDALRRSAFAHLPADRLHELARQAHWVHPRTGTPLVHAGQAQSEVYVVVDGAVEGRRPDDPAGTVRHRLGAGGIVGLASALSGTPAALGWHTAGTTLLAVPSAAVTAAVGPLPGPPPADRDAAAALFAEAPALAWLSVEDRMGMVAGAGVVALAPGAPIALPEPSDAVVVESGVVALPDGTELRRGTLLAPVGEPSDEPVAVARTASRVWRLPAVSGLPMLLGARPAAVAAVAAGAGGPGPRAGVHPIRDYPPLAAPPGPPPSVDRDVDRRFERRLWWLVLLLLLLLLLLTGANLIPGPAWAEMPADRALLTAERGRVVTVVGGREVILDKGDRVYVTEGATITVRSRSTGKLTFRGGAAAILCGGVDTAVGRLWSDETRPVAPHGQLDLHRGRLLADTASTSGAFSPLDLTVAALQGNIVNRGPAWYAVSTGYTQVSTGDVTVDGDPVSPTGEALTCGDGNVVRPPAGTPSDLSPSTVEPTGSASPTPSASPSASPSPSAPPKATRSPARSRTTTTPPRRTTTPPRTTASTTTASTLSPTPTNDPPTIRWNENTGGALTLTYKGRPCTSNAPAQVGYSAYVLDDNDPPGKLRVTLSYSGAISGQVTMSPDGDIFYGQIGPFAWEDYGDGTGAITVTITARDSAGLTSSLSGNPIRLVGCPLIG